MVHRSCGGTNSTISLYAHEWYPPDKSTVPFLIAVALPPNLGNIPEMTIQLYL